MNALEKLLKGKKLSAVFLVLAVLVAVVVVPNLPKNVISVLDNTPVRIILMVIIVSLSLVDPVKALLLAIILVVALMKLTDAKRAVSNNILNNVSDELGDEAGDEYGDAENAFDETEEAPESSFNTTGLNETDMVNPNNSELLNNNSALNNNNLNSVNEPVVLGDVPTNSERTSTEFNAVPYSNGTKNAEVDLSVKVDRDEKPNKIVIGSLLNEGFENPTNKNNLGNNVVDNLLSVDETNPEDELNNVLNAECPVIEHTLEPVDEEKAVKGNFTNEWNLKDIGSNLVNCVGNDEKLVSGNTIGTQGDSCPSGYSF